jgi:hypothetical protein
MNATTWSSVAVERMRPSRLLSHTKPVWVAILVVSAGLNFLEIFNNIRVSFRVNDFRVYYAAAEVGLRYGWSHIYDASLYYATLAELRPAGPRYPFQTPAPIAWLAAPFTLAGYPGAYWFWAVLTVAALGAALWYARPRQHSAILYLIWLAALGPLGWAAWVGNATILVAAAVLVGWRLLETRRDFLGGAVLAATLFKPHLVLLLPPALLLTGRWRAVTGFAAAAGAAGIGMLVTLQTEGLRNFLTIVFGFHPQVVAEDTLGFALGGGPAVVLVQAIVVFAVIVVAVHAGKTRTAWPVVASSLLGSFLLTVYWQPQDYLMLDVAAAMILAAGPLEMGVLVAAGAAIVSTPMSPLTNWYPSREMAIAWLIFAFVVLGFLAARTLTRPTNASGRPSYGLSIAPSEAELASIESPP